MRYFNWRFIMKNDVTRSTPISPSLDSFGVVYRFDPASASLSVVADTFNRPNGLAQVCRIWQMYWASAPLPSPAN